MLKDHIQEGFEQFHKENPKVYDLFIRFAFELKRAGKGRGSASLIFERMRWEIAMTTTDPDFKLNNNYRSRYARKAMEEHAELADFFETRKLHPKVMSDILIPA